MTSILCAASCRRSGRPFSGRRDCGPKIAEMIRYPRSLKRRVQGIVIIEATIGGRPGMNTPSAVDSVVMQAALDAVRHGVPPTR